VQGRRDASEQPDVLVSCSVGEDGGSGVDAPSAPQV
jgi:hypothetical protein